MIPKNCQGGKDCSQPKATLGLYAEFLVKADRAPAFSGGQGNINRWT
jgi:hypothetical protein